VTVGNKKWRWNTRTAIIAAASVIGVLVFAGFRLASSKASMPTGEAKRKEFVEYLEIKGEIKAERSLIVTAPFGAGDLQILNIVANSTKVKKAMCSWSSTGRPSSRIGAGQIGADLGGGGDSQARAAAKLKEEQDLTM